MEKCGDHSLVLPTKKSEVHSHFSSGQALSEASVGSGCSCLMTPFSSGGPGLGSQLFTTPHEQPKFPTKPG